MSQTNLQQVESGSSLKDIEAMEASVKKVVEHVIKPGPANAQKMVPATVAHVMRPD